jgi:hypothetical protein
MKRLIAAAVFTAALCTVASAQAGMSAAHNPMVKNPSDQSSGAPAEGRNSFTQAQAQKHITKAGYTRVGKLTKDDHGVWQGKAMKSGKPVMVMLDYKGDVTDR